MSAGAVRAGAAGLALMLLAGGCATPTATLLEGEAGHPVGALAVLDENGAERAALTAANSRVDLAGSTVRPRQIAERRVARRYGALLADLPPPPVSYLLRFDIGETTPSADQEALLRQMFATVAARPGAEVQVVGHTDRLAGDAVNDALSRRRAEEVRDYLIARGLPADQVRATWRGEREPLVRTADGVANEANRRVEVIVR